MKGGTTINIIGEIMELWFFDFREFDFHRDCHSYEIYTAGRLKNFHNFYLASEDDSFIKLWKRDLLAGQTVTNTEFPMTESRVSLECIGLLHYLCFVLCSSLLVFPSYHPKIPKPSYTTLRPNTKSLLTFPQLEVGVHCIWHTFHVIAKTAAAAKTFAYNKQVSSPVRLAHSCTNDWV